MLPAEAANLVSLMRVEIESQVGVLRRFAESIDRVQEHKTDHEDMRTDLEQSSPEDLPELLPLIAEAKQLGVVQTRVLSVMGADAQLTIERLRRECVGGPVDIFHDQVEPESIRRVLISVLLKEGPTISSNAWGRIMEESDRRRLWLWFIVIAKPHRPLAYAQAVRAVLERDALCDVAMAAMKDKGAIEVLGRLKAKSNG